ncbi:MAG: guanylate kinase [Catonella sp.]|nr:guanylate kinase [Catonella sp.]MDY6357874.1 guanylate kinase [Catonella sp.]
MPRKGVLTVISGFSGVGKGTIVKKLVSEHDEYAVSVSATTRNPRPGEENGRDYFFLTNEAFESMIKDDGLIEYAKYVDHYYGTPRAYVERKLSEGKDVILEIDAQGALQIKKQYPDALLIFIVPPTADVLRERLKGRGTEDADTIKNRLSRAAEETAYIKNYEYVVVNDDLERAVLDVHTVIQSAHMRLGNNDEFLTILSQQIKNKFEV